MGAQDGGLQLSEQVAGRGSSLPVVGTAVEHKEEFRLLQSGSGRGAESLGAELPLGSFLLL